MDPCISGSPIDEYEYNSNEDEVDENVEIDDLLDADESAGDDEFDIDALIFQILGNGYRLCSRRNCELAY